MPATLRTYIDPGILRGIGLDDIILNPNPPVTTLFSSTHKPQTLLAGESEFDNIPAGVPVYYVKDYSSSTDIYVALKAVENGVSAPGYVDLGTGTYWINTYQLPAANDWRGYWNGNRKIMGLIGRVGQTFVKEAANMIPSDARAYALAPSNTGSPVPLQNLYFSNSSTSIPLFFSGITFVGQFQGPYGTAATSGLTLNTSTPSPIPHRGLALWQAIAGSRVQFCFFQGFSYTLKASPPYELGMMESNYDSGLEVYRTEFDGRLATGEVSAGGYMINYTDKIKITDSWLHHTRRSGYALHEHGGGDAGNYTVTNFQIEQIATTSDSFQGSSLGFNASNVEEASGTLTYNNCKFALDRGNHIALGTTAGGPVAQAINVNDFTSLSTNYNGCLVIRIIKTPNSQGNNPYWNLYNTGGLSALPITVKSGTTVLTPVPTTSFNASIHTPNKYYMVVTS